MSTSALSYVSSLQNRFGTIDYSQWQGVRQEFYSYVRYPTAGTNSLTFFADTLGQNNVTKFQTNMPKANSFGQTYFLIKSIHTGIRIANAYLNGTAVGAAASAYSTLDVNNLATDYLNGFLQAGYLDFSIGSRPFLQIPRPFQYLPPLASEPELYGRGNTTVTIAANNQSVVQTDAPLVTQMSGRANAFIIEPSILVEPEQAFSVQINFPTGAVPIAATSVVNDSTNPLFVGVTLDGVLLRPLQ